MSSPAQPTPAQYTELEKVGKLAQLSEPRKVSVNGGKVVLKLNLPRQAVSLLVLSINGEGDKR